MDLQQIIQDRNDLEIFIIRELIRAQKDEPTYPPHWVTPKRFIDPLVGRVFFVLKKLLDNQRTVDIGTIRSSYSEQFTSAEFMKFASKSVSTSQFDYNLTEAWAELKLLVLRCEVEVIASKTRKTKEPAKFIDTEISGLLESLAENKVTSIDEQVISALEATQRRIKARQLGELPKDRFYFGIKGVDNLTGGSSTGKSVTIAAVPAMGKSSFIRKVMRNNFDREPILYFTIEETSDVVLDKFACTIAGVQYMRVSGGTIDQRGYEDYAKAITAIAEVDITIHPIGYISEMAEVIRNWKRERKGKMGIVIVDYIQQVQWDGSKRGTTREQEVKMVGQTLQKMSIELGFFNVMLSQLSRAVNSRGGDKRPMLSDLRESGALEQDAQLVMFLYRPEYYGFETDDEGNSTLGLTELIIAKNSNGPPATVKMQFIHKLMDFEEWTQEGFDPNVNPLNVPPPNSDIPPIRLE